MPVSNDVFSLPSNASWLPLAIFNNDVINAADLASLSLGSAQFGTLRIEDGEVYYKPFTEFSGWDQFTYTIDEGGTLSEGTVSLFVTEPERQEQSFYDDRIAEELPTSQTSIVLAEVAQFPTIDGANQRFNSFDYTENGRYFASTDGREDGEGVIYELIPNGDGTFETEFWFDVGAEVLSSTGRDIDNSNFIFGGLRGIAFHPDFETNGKFYVSMMEQIPGNQSDHTYIGPIYDAGQNGDSVVAEFTVDTTTGDVLTGSYREVFRVSVPVDDHPIRQIEFNKYAAPGDEEFGLLYIAHGDGSIQSATTGGGLRNDALGKILRVDPLQDGENAYSVPDTNPFTDTDSMPDEVYALGFRNPHTLSFTQDENGDVHLFLADVGRDNFEEINKVVAGGNYGWSDVEGIFSLRTNPGTVVGIEPLDGAELQAAIDGEYIFPSTFIGHFGFVTFGPDGTPIEGQVGGGQAIASGHAIRTESVLNGTFIFGDFAKGGRFYEAGLNDLLNTTTTISDGGSLQDLSWVTPAHMPILFDDDRNPDTTPIVYSSILELMGRTRGDIRFNEGPNGEMYITTKRDGTVYEVINAQPDYNDVIFGTDGADVLFGYGGDDRIFGELGDDTIIFSDGEDVVQGGLGADTFVLTENTGVDIITDFFAGYDQLDTTYFDALGTTINLTVNGDDIDLVRDDTSATIARLIGAADTANAAPIASDDVFFPFDADILAAGAGGVDLGRAQDGTGVLDNDGDPDSATISLVAVDGVAGNIGEWVSGTNGGMFRILADGTVAFSDTTGAVPAGVQTSISYEIADSDGLTDTAEVSVFVDAAPVINTAPLAVGDFFLVAPEDAGAYVRLGAINDNTTLLENDFDAEGGPLRIIAANDNGFNISSDSSVWFDGSNGGQFRVFESGVVDFYFVEDEVPVGEFTGFNYTIVDPLDGSSSADVAVYLGGFANDDLYEVSTDTLLDANGGLVVVGRINDDTTALANDFPGASIVAINGNTADVGRWVDASDGGQFRIFDSGVVQFRDAGTSVSLGSTTSVEYTISAPGAVGDTTTATISVQAGEPVVGVNDDAFIRSATAFAEEGSSWFRLAALNDGSSILKNDPDGFAISEIVGDGDFDGRWFDGENGGQFRVFSSGVVDFRNQGVELEVGETAFFEYVASNGTITDTAIVSLTVEPDPDSFVLSDPLLELG